MAIALRSSRTLPCLHPRYKNYCTNSWADKPGWLERSEAALQLLWGQHKPATAPTTRRAQKQGDIDDAIDAIADHDNSDNLYLDELEQWRKYEPQWTKKQYNDGNVIRYWIDLALKYTNLSRLTIDLLTIPASSCECERLFSELGDLLEPRRRKIGAKLLAALQLIRSWVRRGFTLRNEATQAYTDKDMEDRFGLNNWENEE